MRLRQGRIAMACWAITGIIMGGVGCSGGGGGSESAAAVGAATPTASEGPIAGFGSVIMNGVRWNTDRARFEINGRTGRQSDLGIGMVVRVEGERFANGTARADRVIFESRLRGPIRGLESLGPDAVALDVLSVRAIASRSDTRFDGVDFDGLRMDLVVEASGFVNADGDLEITHLRRRDPAVVGASEVKTFGIVSGLAGGSFLIGTTEVRFDGSTLLDDFGPGGLRNGLAVRVEGLLLANDAIEAREIESPRRDRDDRFAETELQGIVTDFVSVSDFVVAGQPVDAGSARFEPNDPTLLREGIRVEVEGPIDSRGVLIADKVKFRSHRVRIHAEIASQADVVPSEDRLWLLGIPIDLDATTRVRDQRDDLPGFDLPDLDAGDFVEVRGVARPDGRVIATRLEREEADDLRLRGPVDLVDASRSIVTILGVEIPTSSRTRFETEDGAILSERAFFDRVAPGVVVQAEDRMDGDETDFDVADEVEIEEPDLEDEDDDSDEDDQEDDSDDDDDEDDSDDDSDDDDSDEQEDD